MYKVRSTPNPMHYEMGFRGEMTFGDGQNSMHFEIYALLVYAL